MEIKFNEGSCRHLRRVVDQEQTQEQTQEVRLPEAMPDVGSVLGAWGRFVIRGKEWRGGSMAVSGGVMAWALYVPEDGSEPRSVETWLPFQMKWELPETRHDGFICIRPCLKSVDARSTSARKMIVRTSVSICAQALERTETGIFDPGQVPEDVQLRCEVYPMELPCEAGEKTVPVDEQLEIPDSVPPVEKLLRYDLVPVILEQRVMASRLVFHGKLRVHMLYLSDGRLCTWDTETAFSQYTDLDREYGSAASAHMIPVMTSGELEPREGQLWIKCGMAVQYVIYDRQNITLVEDAYSPCREVVPQSSQLQLPVCLERGTHTMTLSQQLPGDIQRIVDTTCLTEHPQTRQEPDGIQLWIPGQFQVLYYDAQGCLQCGTARFSQSIPIPADADAEITGMVAGCADSQGMVTGQGVELKASVELQTLAFAREGQTMVTALEVGEPAPADPGRASLILCRYSDTSLWELAKENGSTVEAIRAANQLSAEPEKGRMLLIPVC